MESKFGQIEGLGGHNICRKLSEIFIRPLAKK